MCPHKIDTVNQGERFRALVFSLSLSRCLFFISSIFLLHSSSHPSQMTRGKAIFCLFLLPLFLLASRRLSYTLIFSLFVSSLAYTLVIYPLIARSEKNIPSNSIPSNVCDICSCTTLYFNDFLCIFRSIFLRFLRLINHGTFNHSLIYRVLHVLICSSQLGAVKHIFLFIGRCVA